MRTQSVLGIACAHLKFLFLCSQPFHCNCQVEFNFFFLFRRENCEMKYPVNIKVFTVTVFSPMLLLFPLSPLLVYASSSRRNEQLPEDRDSVGPSSVGTGGYACFVYSLIGTSGDTYSSTH